jgi:hypothetical protein
MSLKVFYDLPYRLFREKLVCSNISCIEFGVSFILNVGLWIKKIVDSSGEIASTLINSIIAVFSNAMTTTINYCILTLPLMSNMFFIDRLTLPDFSSILSTFSLGGMTSSSCVVVNNTAPGHVRPPGHRPPPARLIKETASQDFLSG